MTLHQLAAFHLGSNPDAMDEATRASWRTDGGYGVPRVLPVRLELVGAGSRGEVDLEGLGPWGARYERRANIFGPWMDAGYTFAFNLEWTKDERLWQVAPAQRYWNVDRQRKVVQLQAAVMNVADPAYQAWAVPRIRRAIEVSCADALLVNLKSDRFDYPTQRLSVPGGSIDVRRPEVVDTRIGNQPDLITTTATPGFRDGCVAILTALGLPFYSLIQLRTPSPGHSFTLAQVEAADREWLGEAVGLWRGRP